MKEDTWHQLQYCPPYLHTWKHAPTLYTYEYAHTETDRQTWTHTHTLTHTKESGGPFIQIRNLRSLFFLTIPFPHPLTLQSTHFSGTSVSSSSLSSRYGFSTIVLVLNSQWQSYWKDPCHLSRPQFSPLPSLLPTTFRLIILKRSIVTPLDGKTRSYRLQSSSPCVMMARAFRPCGKTRPAFSLWNCYTTCQRDSNAVYACFCTCKCLKSGSQSIVVSSCPVQTFGEQCLTLSVLFNLLILLHTLVLMHVLCSTETGILLKGCGFSTQLRWPSQPVLSLLYMTPPSEASRGLLPLWSLSLQSKPTQSATSSLELLF